MTSLLFASKYDCSLLQVNIPGPVCCIGIVFTVAIPSNPMISDARSDHTTGATVIVTSGNSYTFTCTAGESRPEPTITWYLGSTEKTANQPTIIRNGKLSTVVRLMTFTPQWTDHDEQLQCRADNDVTPQYKHTHIMLDVYVGPTKPTISGSNIITAGTSVTFTCSTTSRPESTLTWYINNRPQSTNNNTPQNSNGLIITSSDLMFTPNLDNHDGKKLKCKADNEADTSAKEREITLEVQVIPFNIEISSASTGKLIVYNNIESTITCTSIGGKPAATIQWYINNSPTTHDNVQTPDNQQDNRLKDTISTLVLTPTYTEHHNKTLKCEATNDAIDRDQPINEEVVLDVWISPNKVNIDGYSTDDNVTMAAGVEYQLDCTASKAHPPASIEWYKDDVDITTGSNSRILWDSDGKKDTISKLSITPIKEDFGKRIRCESKHDAQSITQHTFVNMIVQYSAVIFNDTLDESSADQGQNATIMCTSMGYPIPDIKWYTWTYGSKVELMSDTTRVVIIHEPYGVTKTIQSTLYIQNVIPEVDYGVYTCHASNIIGSDNYNITLAGRREPGPPTNVRTTGISWDSVNITWDMGYNGGSSQWFYVSYRQIKINDFIRSNKVEMPPYHIDGLNSSTEYEIYVTAENVIAWSKPSKTIIFKTT
ncbi:nephrin-like, partial [Saccoglossus kowalevskii]|uniref:Hemicentin-1-like n=1 Tax=Saccoglossus kowalevskii TaxID=10224 RepID=A0ABM0M4W5_SACKO